MFRRIVSVSVAAIMVVTLVVFGIGSSVPAAQAQAAATRISFAPGATSYVLNTTLVSGTPQNYLLGIRAAQTLWITENGSATVQVFDPLNTSIAGPTSAAGPWGVTVTATGDYTVTLAGAGATTVVFYIPPVWQVSPPPVPNTGTLTRIFFARGASSKTFGTNLTSGVPATYILRLGAGQQMYVTINGSATATVLNPWGGPVTGTATGTGQSRFPIQWTGDYRVVLMGSGLVGVTLYVPPLAAPPVVPPSPLPTPVVPPVNPLIRIRFAAGASSAAVAANLVSGTSARYVLGMGAGQTLYVQAVPEVTSVTITRSGGAALTTFHSGGWWYATGGTTGDYIVTVQGAGATTLTFYIPPL